MPSQLPLAALPDTATLLVSGGDTRIALDAGSGLSMYGCSPQPDPGLVALGSSTASLISPAALQACQTLRQSWLEQLRAQPEAQVYAAHTQRLRRQLLALCGCAPADAIEVVLGASGTDVQLLAGQWLRPHLSVMIAAAETGSGVAAALQGRHFNRRSAGGAEVQPGAALGDWLGRLATLEARSDDGLPRQQGSIDSECVACVQAAVEAGQRVLLVLTDVSKTGLLVPGVGTVLGLKQRWPELIEVLVDACQFRLAPATVRAYLAQGCMVALTGSKFMAGPTFSGALLVPPPVAARYRERVGGAALHAYAGRADWPEGWAAGMALAPSANFGMLLRWEAALTEMRAFGALPDHRIGHFLRRFAATLRHWMTRHRRFEALAVPALERGALRADDCWDSGQTIFPFLLLDGRGQALPREATLRLFQQLRYPAPGAVEELLHGQRGAAIGHGLAGATDGAAPRRFQLGQPVACGTRDGVAVSALRLCISAPMVVAACRDGQEAKVVNDALAALEELALLLD